MASARLYNDYADRRPDARRWTRTCSPRSSGSRPRARPTTRGTRQLLMEHHYVLHVCRLPLDDWPDPVKRALAHINPAIYVPMQGPSELGLSGTLEDWDRTADLPGIDVPTLVIGATHDTMDPGAHALDVRAAAAGPYLHCPDGSHLRAVRRSRALLPRADRVPEVALAGPCGARSGGTDSPRRGTSTPLQPGAAHERIRGPPHPGHAGHLGVVHRRAQRGPQGGVRRLQQQVRAHAAQRLPAGEPRWLAPRHRGRRRARSRQLHEQAWAARTTPFDQWFVNNVAEVHGIDMRGPVPPMPKQLL